MPTPAQVLRVSAIDGEIVAARKVLATATPALEAGQHKWEVSEAAKLPDIKSDWQAVRPSKADSSGGAKLDIQDDHSLLSTGNSPAKDTYTITLPLDKPGTTALRLEALPFPGGGLCTAHGNLVLQRLDAPS